ncbi:MAG: hypothetical protein K2M13_08585 [Muribaculaceae bacterium]|nr:hypothetical protein [Muribaculaceae bacterium]
MQEENVAIRLKGFMDSLGLTSSQFADQCGIARPTLSQLLTGRNKKISDVLIGQIHTAFPQLSIVWLLFGEGSMLVNNDEDKDDSADLSDNSTAGQPVFSDGFSDFERTPTESKRSSQPAASRTVSSNLESMLIEKDAEIEELRRELDQLRKTPRKVASITVYYDDSTFETFYPGSQNGKNGR